MEAEPILWRKIENPVSTAVHSKRPLIYPEATTGNNGDMITNKSQTLKSIAKAIAKTGETAGNHGSTYGYIENIVASR